MPASADRNFDAVANSVVKIFSTVRYPDAATSRHAAARYAIHRIGYLLAADPDRWATASARLEAEYAALE